MIIDKLLKSNILKDACKGLMSKKLSSGVAGSPMTKYTNYEKSNIFAKASSVFSTKSEAITPELEKFTKTLPNVDIGADPRYYNQAKKCIDHLQGENPVEYGILINDTKKQVKFERVGNAEGCVFAGSMIEHECKMGDSILMHGHTKIKNGKEMTLPVSFQDFKTLHKLGLTKIIAYNSKGQYSMLEKAENFRKLSETEMKDFRNSFIKNLLDKSPKDKVDEIRKLKEYVNQNPDAQSIKAEIADRLTALQYLEGADKIVDSFWKENASKVGLKYVNTYM